MLHNNPEECRYQPVSYFYYISSYKIESLKFNGAIQKLIGHLVVFCNIQHNHSAVHIKQCALCNKFT